MNHVALITGAGSGIGLATALALAREGYRLCLVGRSRQKLDAAASAVGGANVVIADLEDIDQAVRMIDECVAAMARLDVLINNAGWSPAATIPQTTPDIVRRVFAVNVESPALAIARAWPIFERQAAAGGPGGVVVNISSIASIDPFPILYAYAAAKAGVNNLAKSVAIQGRPIGVRGFAVAPGAVETDLLRSLVGTHDLPESRTLRPGQVADVILQCVNGVRDADNGSTIYLPNP